MRNPQSHVGTEHQEEPEQSEASMSTQGQMNKPSHAQAAQKKAVASQ